MLTYTAAAPLFRVWAPVQAATLLDGVPAALQTKLNDLRAPAAPEPLSHFWGLLTEAEHKLLNALAAAHDAAVFADVGI